MPKTIDRLKTDHRRLRNVLGALTKKGEELHTHNLVRDTDHLFCLIEYVTNYPDKIHHPLEDTVFDELVRANLTPEQTEKVENNRRQHEQLTADTNNLLARVDALRDDKDVESFKSDIDHYVNRQLEHMRFEEEEVFPLALDALSEDAWKTLDDRFGATNDPLFDQIEQDYRAIYPYLDADPEEANNVLGGEPLYRYLSATGIASTS